MLFLQIFIFALSVIAVSPPRPTATGRSNLLAYYICGDDNRYAYSKTNNDGIVVYTRSEIDAAVRQAYPLFLDGKTVAGRAGSSGRPARTYPARFWNSYQYPNIDPRFQNRPMGLLEFPIVKNRLYFNEGDPQGLDRVIFDPVTGLFVALMTHRGNKLHYGDLFPCFGQNDPPGGAIGEAWGSIPVPMHGGFFGSSGNLPFKRSFDDEDMVEIPPFQTFPHPALITPGPIYNRAQSDASQRSDGNKLLSDCSYIETTITDTIISPGVYKYCQCANDAVAGVNIEISAGIIYSVCAGSPYPIVATVTSLPASQISELATAVETNPKCEIPDFCNAYGCAGANSFINSTFGVCQIGDCAGYLCKNVPLPAEFSTTLPCNSTECYGMVANSTSTDGLCLHGNYTGMSCTPSCPLTELSCTDCNGTLDNTGTGVCGNPFYAGCPCQGDCPATPVNCNINDCQGINNATSGVGFCAEGSLRGCPCHSVCGPNGPCNLYGCEGYNLQGYADGIGRCTNGDYIGCDCTSICVNTTSVCGSLPNCNGLQTNGSASCTSGAYAGCECDMQCPDSISCADSTCYGIDGACQNEEYFGCNCQNTTATITTWTGVTTEIITMSSTQASPSPSSTPHSCVKWTDCPSGFCPLAGESVSCTDGVCVCWAAGYSVDNGTKGGGNKTMGR